MFQFKERKRNRLKNYDYTNEGYYFVTVCTHHLVNWFGDVVDGEMKLNDHGEIIQQQWEWLPNQYPYIRLDQYIVMPNHLHGIVVIGVGNGRDRSVQVAAKIKSLSSLIGAFKTTSSKKIHQAGKARFKWKKSFHDHIIRNERSLKGIREYITNNPLNWKNDERNPKMPNEALQPTMKSKLRLLSTDAEF